MAKTMFTDCDYEVRSAHSVLLWCSLVRFMCQLFISVFLVSCFNFSFSFSHLLVLVTQISHQNECDHTR